MHACICNLSTLKMSRLYGIVDLAQNRNLNKKLSAIIASSGISHFLKVKILLCSHLFFEYFDGPIFLQCFGYTLVVPSCGKLHPQPLRPTSEETLCSYKVTL